MWSTMRSTHRPLIYTVLSISILFILIFSFWPLSKFDNSRRLLPVPSTYYLKTNTNVSYSHSLQSSYLPTSKLTNQIINNNSPNLPFQFQSRTLQQWRILFTNHKNLTEDKNCFKSSSKSSGYYSKFLEDREKAFAKSKFVVKRVFNPEKMAVFWAGLEKTGHHFVYNSLWRFCQDPETSEQVCQPFNNIAKLVKCGDQTTTLRKQTALDKLEQDVNQSKYKWLLLKDVNSYPLCRPPNYPNLTQLAEIFERLNVDFRVILLDRNPESIVASSVAAHWAPSVTSAANIYYHSLRILQLQLESLDPRFVVGAFSVERSAEDNLKASQYLTKSLGIPRKMWEHLFESFLRENYKCVTNSPGENRTEWEQHMVKLYQEAYSYRQFVDKFFEDNISLS